MNAAGKQQWLVSYTSAACFVVPDVLALVFAANSVKSGHELDNTSAVIIGFCSFVYAVVQLRIFSQFQDTTRDSMVRAFTVDSEPKIDARSWELAGPIGTHRFSHGLLAIFAGLMLSDGPRPWYVAIGLCFAMLVGVSSLSVAAFFLFAKSWDGGRPNDEKMRSVFEQADQIADERGDAAAEEWVTSNLATIGKSAATSLLSRWSSAAVYALSGWVGIRFCANYVARYRIDPTATLVALTAICVGAMVYMLRSSSTVDPSSSPPPPSPEGRLHENDLDAIGNLFAREVRNMGTSYKPHLWERITVFALAAAVVILVMALAIRNEPFRDQNLVLMLRTILSLSVAALGAIVPGFLDVGVSGRGIAVRAGGALALFVLTFFFTPHVLPL